MRCTHVPVSFFNGGLVDGKGVFASVMLQAYAELINCHATGPCSIDSSMAYELQGNAQSINCHATGLCSINQLSCYRPMLNLFIDHLILSSISKEEASVTLYASDMIHRTSQIPTTLII